jgi:hypothetical protein
VTISLSLRLLSKYPKYLLPLIAQEMHAFGFQIKTTLCFGLLIIRHRKLTCDGHYLRNVQTGVINQKNQSQINPQLNSKLIKAQNQINVQL